MQRTLVLVGVVSLFLWTALGLVAWTGVARRVTVVLSEEADAHRTAQAAPERDAALADELGTLRQDVRALTQAMGESLQALDEGLRARQDEHAEALRLELSAWRDEVGSRTVSPSSSDRLDDLPREPAVAQSPAGDSGAGSPVQPVSTAGTPAVERGPAQPRRSFLAFRLPSDDFRFDERRSWTVLPALSRVGFDAETTLHDFTAATSAVEGELSVDLAHPDAAPRARLAVQSRSLASGDDARDASMRENLAVAEHPLLEFELERFVSETVDADALRARGRAEGRMTIRGVQQAVSMPVELSVDDARRLCVDGQMALDLERFRVPVPNKLGLITMEKEVQVWISLRLRVQPRTEG